MSSKRRFKSSLSPGLSPQGKAERADMPGSRRLPLDMVVRIDGICERFERALRSDQPMRLEDCLRESAAESVDPASLLRELLALELEYRLFRGERPTREEYLTRFPSHNRVVDFVFQESADRQSEATPSFLIDHPRYRVVRLIGSGGMGSVYLAEQRALERAVALKVINADLLSDERMVERFRSEAKAAAKLSHPNVVAVYDAETAGEGHLLVMEYVVGTDLAKRVVERGPLPIAAACDYIRQAALGLQHAHEHRMVHRDISPRNLMLTDDGRVKVLDFGLAYFASEAATVGGRVGNRRLFGKKARRAKREAAKNVTPAPSPQTAANFLLGSIDYMAPEQATDPHSADIRADVYSLGCTLFFLLTGQPPFPHGTLVEKLDAHASRTPPAIEELRHDVPPELSLTLARMLSKSPADRFQTPQDVAMALTPLAGVAYLPAPKRTWWRGRRRWIAAAAGLFVCVLAAIGWKMKIWNPTVPADKPPINQAVQTAESAETKYREGVMLLKQRCESQIDLAILRLHKAIKLAPKYTAAYAKLADAYNLCGDYGWDKPEIVFPKAKEAAQEAIKLDKDLAEAHLALAFVLDAYDGDSRAAEKEFKLALKLKPKLADAHHWYAWFLIQQGRPKEAAKEIELALKYGPDELIIVSNAGKIAYFQRNYPLAIERHKYALKLDRKFSKAHRDLAMVYAETGKPDDALRELEKATDITEDGRDQMAARAYVYAKNGKPEMARDLLKKLSPLADRKPLAYDIAAVYAALGDKDQAFKWLQRAFKERAPGRRGIGIDPRLDPIRSDPRFKLLADSPEKKT